MNRFLFTPTVALALASPLAIMAAENGYITDIRPLEKDIREIEKLQPLRSIDQKRTGIATMNKQKTSRKSAGQKVSTPK